MQPYTVQGPGEASPLEGETVTVAGVVTQVTPDLRGFFVQGDTDGDPRTSEALFIFAPGHSMQTERRVAVTGQVKEFHGLTELTRVSQVVDCGPGELPDPVALGAESGNRAGEPLENMRVSLPATRIIDNYRLLDVGEIILSDGDHQWTLEDASNQRRLDAIPWGLPQNAALLGNGNSVEPLTGVLTWRWNRWVVLPDETPDITPADWTLNPRDTERLRIVSFNIENLFNGLDGDFSHSRGPGSEAEWQRQRDKVAQALIELDADLLLLQEMEHDWDSDNPVLIELTETLRQLDGRHYSILAPEPRPGDDAITNAYLFDPEVLQPAGDLHLVDTHPRPALAQRFRRLDTDAELKVINVHMKSRGRGCIDLCKADRAEELEQILAWFEGRPDNGFRLLGGDFNTLTDESLWEPLLENAWERLAVEGPTYWFRGRAQQIDHFWMQNAPANLQGAVQPGHAEMPPIPFLHDLYEPQSPWGASDHNPVILQW
ncbi:MAG: endonuclease/exonuclease/phosphatase family protein [Natronospirillum sp.]|uniref:endonuclease/exonuclease/phosphatase family protein n=1 Tax=Natronospirillum sp. TaxID=2812955 RepID=UPI0025EDD834|nr:endonuclease/exonuclease/phosphatase family protein [Natronospirillum sp.]MCH8550543.1 endonuclease/exonuclease/phosphatase family protein [Natronospirillum sp.]